MKSIGRFFKKLIIYSVVTLLCLELALWILGYRPYSTVDYKVTTNPPTAFQGDSLLGLRLNPGVYNITLNEKIEFTATHSQDGQRVLGPHAHLDEATPNIHFFGCSYTYGYGVNDDESFAALVQERFNINHVENHGVIGYGTVQSALQLKEEYIVPDDLVLLVLSSQHLMRNTLSQEYRSHLKIGFENSSKNLDKNMEGARFPYMSACGEEIEYADWNEVYENWPLRGISAAMNLFQTTYDKLKGDEAEEINVTACLIDEMFDLCKSKSADFAVICLDNDEKTAQIAQKLPHIPWIDVNFDFAESDYTNAPFDNHPNVDGHQLIAETIIPFIENLMK